MIRKASRLVANRFDELGIRYNGMIEEEGNGSIVSAAFATENGTNVTMRFISTDEDNDVSVRIYELVKVSEACVPAVLQGMNECNRRLRYFHVSMDEDGRVHAAYDFPVMLPDEAVGDAAAELLLRGMEEMNDAYAVLLSSMRS